ncbi:glycosyltransferase [Roseibium denhamense]|uniref:Glycosyltransferase involved in cell wall bisynthesis n=1 Tax=Roseibium denhamense TaxID=76305 RepID=A0ABY1PL44_9HYPH|nr:glycosyltransferase [Roseibium denhamense]MTI07009.1 glycosyltransferase [Roseibium denhamense]SMP36583.1 Glycosyltransferase involved in cell wall bisynthesis [Roseibium denhamense]
MVTKLSNRPRKLAHIHLGVDGGAERFFVRLSKALAERDVEQIAFIRPDRSWRDELARHCDVRELTFSRSHIKRHFVRWHITHEIKKFGASSTLGWMSPASKWLPKPGPNMRTFLRLGDWPDGFHTYGNVQHLIGNTPDIVAQAIEMGWPADRATVISNFVEPLPEDLKPVDRAAYNTPSDAIVLVHLGRFVQRKRFDLMIKAVAQLPQTVHAWLIGDGELMNEMIALARSLSVEDRVHFMGWQRDPAPYLKAADILVCPTDDEPLGNIVLEGWNVGLPVIAAASPGPSWLIENGVNGLLFPCGDVEGLIYSVRNTLARADKIKSLVKNGTQSLEQNLSAISISDQYLRLFSMDISSS